MGQMAILEDSHFNCDTALGSLLTADSQQVTGIKQFADV